jgi:hypothetical protein
MVKKLRMFGVSRILRRISRLANRMIVFSAVNRHEDQREVEMLIILLISVVAMLSLQATQTWAYKDALYALVIFSSILAVVIHQSRNRGAVRWIINIIAAAFGAFLAIPVIYWGMRIADPFIPSVMTTAVGYAYAAMGTITIVFFTWSPIKVFDLFRRS